jgi:energy-coupling factor transporter ATP-binding protein EcfA2
MRRRLSLAMALVGASSAVLLDEVSAGLDPAAKRSVWRVLRGAVRASPAAFLLVTHDMEEVAVLAGGAGDAVAVMARGRLRTLAPLPELLRHYAAGALLRVHFRGRGGAWERAHAAVTTALFPWAAGSAAVDPGHAPHFTRLGGGAEESGWAVFAVRVGRGAGMEVPAGEAFARMRGGAAAAAGIEMWALVCGAGELETAFHRITKYYN